MHGGIAIKVRFLCNACNRRQKLEVGTVLVVDRKNDPLFLFEKETKCRFCGKENISPSSFDRFAFLMKPLISAMKKDAMPQDILLVGEKAIIEENKKINWADAIPYFEQKLEKDPNNWETLLRYANSLRKNGRVNQAISTYERVKKLNPNCAAAYANLGSIYFHRVKQYGEKQFKQAAIENLSKAEEFLLSRTGDQQTVNDYDAILSEVVNSLSELSKRGIYYEAVPEEELNQPLRHFVIPDKKMVPIHDMGEYSTLFLAIEKPIMDYWKQKQGLNDETTVETLESLKKSFDAPQNELGERIKQSMKATLIANKIAKKQYSEGEALSCIVRIKNLAKKHYSFDGIGYLKWLERFFDGTLPQTPEEIEEYLKKEEIGKEITAKRGIR